MRGIVQLALLCSLTAMAVAQEHPTPLTANTPPAQCLSCHQEKGAGKSVHSAIAMGCSVCHVVGRRGGVTTVTLTAPAEQICFNCHTKAESRILHQPYQANQCTLCHDPHSSEHARQLRLSVNALCLECHRSRNGDSGGVRVLGRHDYSAERWRNIPKVELDGQLKAGHPTGRHPVAGIADPRNQAETISCLSCHAAHASPSPKLLLGKKGPNRNLCEECHRRKPGLPEVTPGEPPAEQP